MLLRKLPPVSFEKTAARSLLGDAPANWPNELLGALYKQQPYLSTYQVDLQIKSQDEATGVLYAVFVVKQTLPPTGGLTSPGMSPPADPVSIRVPVIVKSRQVYPMDVFINQTGSFLPMTQTRVGSAMQDAQAFRSVAPSAATRPYSAAGGGTFSAGVPAGGMTGGYDTGYGDIKQASLIFRDGPAPYISREVQELGTRALLYQVSMYAPEQIKEACLQRVNNSSELRGACLLSPSFMSALSVIGETETIVKTAALLPDQPILPDDAVSIVLSKTAGGYNLTTARPVSAGYFKIATAQINRRLVNSLPLSFRQEALDHGIAVLSDTSEELQEIDSQANKDLQKVAIADEHLRVYVGRASQGEFQNIAVLTKTASLDGKPSRRTMVIGDSGMSLQEAPVGMPTGLAIKLAELQPGACRGDGFFIFGDTVTEPVRIRHAVVNLQEGSTTYLADDWLGRSVQIKTASVLRPIEAEKGVFLMPSTAVFVPIDLAKGPYETDVGDLLKQAAFVDRTGALTVRGNLDNGVDVFSPTGEKLASLSTRAESLAYLAAIGDSPAGALKKLASLTSGKVAKLVVAPKTRLQKEAAANQVPSVTPAEMVQICQIVQQDLVKEAAMLSAPDTVDAVLSLGFVTPETVESYLEHLPVLEEAVSRLAEIVVGARMGVPDVPESAATSALSGMEKAVQGLKMLQIRLSLTPDAGE